MDFENDCTELDNAAKLRKILDFAWCVGWGDQSKDANGLYPIHNLIRIFADKISYERFTRTIYAETLKPTDIEEFCGHRLFTANRNAFYSITDIRRGSLSDPQLSSYWLKEHIIIADMKLNLNAIPLLCNSWSVEKLENSFKKVGTAKNTWKENCNTHEVMVLLPFGLTIPTNDGRHSIETGRVKGCGELTITSEPTANVNAHNKVIDLSFLYDKIEFDGQNYVSRIGKPEKCLAASFEFGVIFEIGRILYENDVDFLGVKCGGK